MKHCKASDLRTCIFKPVNYFKADLKEMFGKNINVDVDYDTVYFYDDNDESVSYEDILAKLSDYYGTKVTSFHADDFAVTGIWIVYRGE